MPEHPVPSPFYQPDLPAFKAHILRQLDLLILPVPVTPTNHSKECDRECHLTERNYTIAVIKDLFK